MDLDSVFAPLGHLASRRQLVSLGLSRHTIDRAVRDGIILPVRRGWVAMPVANQVAVRAVLQGGRLTGATALRSYGVWAGSDMRVHVQVPPGSHRVSQRAATSLDRFASPRFSYGEVVLEWASADSQPANAPQWRVSAPDALVRFARAESAEQIAAAIESLVHEKRMSRRDVARLEQRLPRRLRRMLARLTFKAESGLETIGRLRLEDIGYLVQQQVETCSNKWR